MFSSRKGRGRGADGQPGCRGFSNTPAQPFSHYPSGLKIRVHDKARLNSLGRSVAAPDADGALVVDLDRVICETRERPDTAASADAAVALPVKP